MQTQFDVEGGRGGVDLWRSTHTVVHKMHDSECIMNVHVGKEKKNEK